MPLMSSTVLFTSLSLQTLKKPQNCDDQTHSVNELTFVPCTIFLLCCYSHTQGYAALKMLKEKSRIHDKSKDLTGKYELSVTQIAAHIVKIWTEVIIIFKSDLKDHTIVTIHEMQELTSQYVSKPVLKAKCINFVVKNSFFRIERLSQHEHKAFLNIIRTCKVNTCSPWLIYSLLWFTVNYQENLPC